MVLVLSPGHSRMMNISAPPQLCTQGTPFWRYFQTTLKNQGLCTGKMSYWEIQSQCKARVGAVKSPSASLRQDAQHLEHSPGHTLKIWGHDVIALGNFWSWLLYPGNLLWCHPWIKPIEWSATELICDLPFQTDNERADFTFKLNVPKTTMILGCCWCRLGWSGVCWRAHHRSLA